MKTYAPTLPTNYILPMMNLCQLGKNLKIESEDKSAENAFLSLHDPDDLEN